MSETPKREGEHGSGAKSHGEGKAHGKGQHEAGAHEAAAHEAGAHAHSGKHKSHDHDHGPGTPPWLISFGDMMTLFLCFFIMLVTMAKSQDAGLMASGLGPLMAELGASGEGGALNGDKTLQLTNEYRQRFGLAALTEEELQAGVKPAATPNELEELVKSSLRPYSALGQPLVATFAADSAELSSSAKRYLDLLADTLRPGRDQVLVLEGHADDAAERFAHDNVRLAVMRAIAVQDYVVKEHGFVAVRVEARAFAKDDHPIGPGQRGVDARLVQPAERPQS